ncbi:uncharacterized protein LOC107269976 isoform X1 [Cephus cinctus]|uniref:Uncharacterized protein LOC107269976 isoform X1 n=1 Tax=Cephus cinctus TaxID=211228 RepID=A0AAJ7C233_CEPCN|nr:uncharacterized protein LOC107269976 isoform X1 [Cephus cinctus]XP_015599968.1 uncharacterized protein LOC107269976 isoform X1 [Cephus cinctus]XP_015599969.1 uncharacterized protein LOC107269976 isoform X1 [Cephus cinctus]XP_015599970.1 uncharacterized protein LOC107269976 isoform X1 [Cephus cinctus]XP_024943136.1 uncharacterized protein LOC107269976 isoform X1 [Cephus cinctus]XP_024943137.1 uncharacterized protein LOC107269976 isoform X1 [Cephus cinctus]
MGFKWFRARMRMNRMPSHSSAVAGSYKPMSQFDCDLIIPNNNGTTLGSVPMPILNNPMAGLNNSDVEDGFMRKFSKSMNDLITQEDIYTVSTGPPRHLSGVSYTNLSEQRVEVATPKPVVKSHKAEYRRKKAQAPVPKMLNKLNQPENNGAQVLDNKNRGTYVTIDKPRSSQESDIEI